MIADKPYSITITPEEEEVVRRAAKMVNDKIAESRKKYDAPTIDHLAMASLMTSIENERNKEKYRYSVERIELDELARSVENELGSH